MDVPIRLLILGASYSQVPLIRAAKRLGYETVAASIPGDYAGLKEADDIAYVDITDPEAVLIAAQEAKIDGAATCCMDVGIRAQGYVCEKMELPGPGIFATEAACDKSVEKEAYVRSGVNTAPYFLVRNEEELEEALKELNFPVILKAVDLMGSRGIFRADTPQEARENFHRSMEATSRDFCIVEEFIEGTMFGVEAMIYGGQLMFCLPLGNIMREGNPSFPIGHYVPWEHAGELQEEIEDQVMKVAQALEFDDCGIDLDCMYKDGKIYVIEATARAGATCITDTVGIYYGIDYYEALVKVAMGESPRDMFHGPQIPKRPSVTRLLGAEKTGTVEEICIFGQPYRNDGPWSILQTAEKGAKIEDLSFNIKEGSRVQPLANGRDRIGQLIISGDTLEEAKRLMDRTLDQIRVKIREQDGVD